MLITFGSAPAGLFGQDRLARKFGAETDLLPPVVALAQDSTGFLWVGTRAGLFRYEGARFRRWAPEMLPRAVGSIAISLRGTAVVVDADGRIVELTAAGARVLPGSARRSPDHTQIAAFDAEERLWVVAPDGRIQWRDPTGDWHALPPELLQGDTVRMLFSAGSLGGILVTGADGLWQVRHDSPPRQLLDDHLVVDALALGTGRILALTHAHLISIDPLGATDVLPLAGRIPPTRTIALAERFGTVWVATDRYLIALTPEGVADVLGPEHDVVAGGPLLVDHEGSLWHGGYTALTQYPEPDTKIWLQRHGLRSNLTRFLARSNDVLWLTTWQGPAFLRLDAGRWQAGSVEDWWSWGRLCTGADGNILTGTGDGVVRLQSRDATIVLPGTGFNFGMCVPAFDGGFWVGAGTGLHHLSADGATLTSLSSIAAADGSGEVSVVLEDRSQRLWVSGRERMCHAPARAVRAGAAVEWSCSPLPAGTVHLTSMVELPSGALWAASATLGVLHQTADGWEPLEENASLPMRSVLNLVPSPRGGVWLVGAGILQRVAERSDGAGWTVLEQLAAWHGLPSVGGGDLLEEDDGTVWIATSQGVIQVPPGVRSVDPLPPRMALVEARVDGQPVSLGEDLVLPADRNRLELHFAALTFRDRGRIRYQVRLSPRGEWASTEEQPSFTWVDLAAGEHQPQVRATLDGASWSPQPAGLAFRVLPPWYRTAWALTGFALLAGTLLFGLYRARLAYLLGLERQRTRIAMDLHDEMGSGLASIGILAGVLSENGNDPDGGRRIAHEVATTAEELGTSLSDIVWALDPQRATLEELAARLAEHGGRLFADDVQFDTQFPARWPPQPLSLSVRRNVLLIGLEALHNAARHADAQRVLLSLQPMSNDWIMMLSDDGRGLPPRHMYSARGRGLRAMRRRAAEIGGAISWTSQPGQGTTMRLSFELAPQRSRLFGWLHRFTRRGSGAPASHDHASAPSRRTVHR
jgi:signal transduction histidine kinase/ligand-binding sensor domain-containing protein